ncbi:aminopeptidase P family protein [Halonotius terrestris]|uniref:Aminopeptidase P family protein n=1 Tax=Halonotius terrestris TaxID=2487750 RepID=A0A8J8P889_9EURY|nr:Xaa-Pro peptidase family protein [Halonotius terrestris]TQQ80042.1 aminopeptidase P family protein [Halonotius terrestris]
MEPDFSPLAEHLADRGIDAYLIDADGDDANQRYLSGFDAPDPFLTCYRPDGIALLVSGLEYGRAVTESRADTVERPADYDRQQLVADHGAREADRRVRAAFLADKSVESVLVPERFPLDTADGLRDHGITVTVDNDDRLMQLRAVKTPTELDYIRDTQHANERAMDAAESLLAAADVDADGTLVHDGEALTSERVKHEIEATLLEYGCGLDSTIVAGGRQAADPHERGSGPLHAEEAIIIDIFPRDKETGYHSDMTRTFCVGEPNDTLQEWYDLTEQALDAALDAVEAGASGADVHAAACEVYEEAGLPTFRTDPTTEVGFIHSTGHGVGLAIHEYPRLSPEGGDLEAGQVITVEPGLYDPEVGGIRIEDIVIVTEDGYENITDYSRAFVVG